jgi:hypothetical protein
MSEIGLERPYGLNRRPMRGLNYYVKDSIIRGISTTLWRAFCSYPASPGGIIK